MWYPPRRKEAPARPIRRTFGDRLAALHKGFGKNRDVVDVDYIRAQVSHWTARHAAGKYGILADFEAASPYHVVREGDRVVVTPPRSPLIQSESWEFSPGRAELTVSPLVVRKPWVTSYAVDRIWIIHRVWKNGRGSSDALRINKQDTSDVVRVGGSVHGSHTVVALDYYLARNVMRPPGRGFSWSVSPTLDDPAADGAPEGISEDSEPDVISPVAPAILALSRVIAAATGRPVSTLVDFIRQPVYDNGA